MLEELQKKSTKSTIATSVIIFIIGIILLVCFGKNVFSYAVGATTFEDLAPDEIKPGMYVEVQLMDNFGWFMEEYTENTKTHKQTTEYLYYVIWTGDDYATDYRFMAIRVPYSYMSRMETMADNTYEGLRGETIPFTGYIRSMTSEDKGYFKEYFTSSGWTTEEYEDGTLPYYIEVTEKTSMTFEIIFVIGGALLIVWGIIRIIMASKGGKMKKFNKDLEDYGFTAASLEADYQSAKNNPNKLSGILAVGQHALYYMDGAHPRMVPTTKLLWAYTNITQHRTYGIPTGKTYSVQVYAEGRGNFVAIGAKNEANAKEILEYLVSRYPWMVVGYSAELSGLYAKDLAAFKSLKYDKEIVNANMF